MLARSPDDATWLAGWDEMRGANPLGLNTMPHFRIPVGAIVADLHSRAGDPIPKAADPMLAGSIFHTPTEET